MSDQIQIYRSRLRRHRWRYVHANGQVTGGPQQGYSRRIDCLNNVKALTGLRDGQPGYLVGYYPDGSPRTVRLVDLSKR